jgi:hypothetical protein
VLKKCYQSRYENLKRVGVTLALVEAECTVSLCMGIMEIAAALSCGVLATYPH